MKLESKEVIKRKIVFMTIKDFIKKYKLDTNNDLVRYYMNKGEVDYMQPARDYFVLLTAQTKSFYGIR